MMKLEHSFSDLVHASNISWSMLSATLSSLGWSDGCLDDVDLSSFHRYHADGSESRVVRVWLYKQLIYEFELDSSDLGMFDTLDEHVSTAVRLLELMR